MFKAIGDDINIAWRKVSMLQNLYKLRQRGLLEDLKENPIGMFIADDNDYDSTRFCLGEMNDLYGISGISIDNDDFALSDIFEMSPDNEDAIRNLFDDVVWCYPADLKKVIITNPIILKAIELGNEVEKQEIMSKIYNFFTNCMIDETIEELNYLGEDEFEERGLERSTLLGEIDGFVDYETHIGSDYISVLTSLNDVIDTYYVIWVFLEQVVDYCSDFIRNKEVDNDEARVG